MLRAGRALVRLAGHSGLLLAAGALILTAQSSIVWCSAILIYGIALMFLFSLEHETIHGTGFRSPWLNAIVAEVAGLPLLLPSRYFRYFHFAHHRHTQDPSRDPELVHPKPNDWPSYVKHLSGIPYWRDAILGLLRHALARADEDFVPAGGKSRVIAEARVYL